MESNYATMSKGSEIVVCARVGGANTTSFLVAHFAKRNTKNCGGEKRSGESEGGQKFLPPNPLPFCPPERSVLVLPREARLSVGILFKMSSDFFQQTPLLRRAGYGDRRFKSGTVHKFIGLD
jgi:hypothetical protein